MAKDVNWAEMDKRIRARKTTWSKEELDSLDANLSKLPDCTEEVVGIDIPQPAVDSGETQDDEAPPQDNAAEPTDRVADPGS